MTVVMKDILLRTSDDDDHRLSPTTHVATPFAVIKKKQMNLKQHLPESLKGPRTYFSLIDRNNPNLLNNWDLYKDDLDRVLKILLLTKDSIVIAGSALCNEKALDYFSEDEYKSELFKKGIIKPAIRSQFQTFEQVFYDRVNNRKENILQSVENYFSDVITEIVPWDLQDNSGWYRQRIIEQLEDNNSFLNKSIGTNKNQLRKFVKITQEELTQSKQDYFNRDRYRTSITENLNKKHAFKTSQFLDLLYFVGGSRVVNCENYVPDEILSYYNNAIFNHSELKISENTIFIDVLVNLILDNLYENFYDPNLIDNISFKEILQLREMNKTKSIAFREKYDECLKISGNLSSFQEKDGLVLKLEEMLELSDNLKDQFKESVTDEIKSFKSMNSLRKKSKSIDNIFEFAVNFAGIFSVPVSVVNLLFNNCGLKELGVVKSIQQSRSNFQDNLLRKYVKNKYKNDPILIDYINDLVEVHKENYMRLKI